MRGRVFVYGTLRPGGSNHHLLAGSRHHGTCTTEAAYRMLDLGSCPGVVEGGETAVTGDVFTVTPAVFRDLDALEDYPRTYTRTRIHTPWGEAWMYIYRPRGRRAPEIASGDWLAHAGARRR